MEPQKLDTRQYYDGAPIGVWLTQPTGRVVFVCRDMWEWMQNPYFWTKQEKLEK